MEQFGGQNILNFIKELPNDDACKAKLNKTGTKLYNSIKLFCINMLSNFIY